MHVKHALLTAALIVAAGGPAFCEKKVVVCDDVQQPSSLDPYSVFSEKVHTVLQQMLEGLVRFAPDGSLEPALAESWERRDPLTMRFHLREGVRFHNGEVLDADSVKFSIERYISPEVRYPGFPFVATLQRVDIVDPLTVDVVTSIPDGLLLNRLAAWVHIVPVHYYVEKGSAAFSLAPVGSGPFKFESWTPNEVRMTRNADYWMKGSPKLDSLVFRFLPADQQLDALFRGEVNLLTSVPGTQTLAVQKDRRTRLIKQPTFLTVGSSMRTTDGPLADRRVRLAMNYAVNHADLIRYDVLGNGQALGSLSFEGQFGHDSGIKPYPYDLKKAKALLQEAGYPEGFKLKTFLKINAERTGRMLATQLERVGIHLDLTLVPDAQLVEYFGKEKWDITIGDVPDPMNHFYFIAGIFVYSRSPYSLVRDPEFDAKLEAMAQTLDIVKQESLARELDRYIHDQALGLFTYQRVRTYALSSGLDFSPYVSGMPYFFSTGWTGGGEPAQKN